MQYKILFCDIDNTLLKQDSTDLPTHRVKEAIQHALQKGIHICLASARPTTKVDHIFKYLGLTGYGIMSGGAEIIDIAQGTLLRERIIDRDVLHPLIQLIKKYECKYWIQDDGVDDLYTSAYIPFKPYVIVVQDMKQSEADALIKECNAFPNIRACKASSLVAERTNVMISHREATKQSGVEFILDLLKISEEETVGIGDGYNDVPLLEACGLKVAMGNSVPELLLIADYVAPAVGGDGVAEVIERFFL